MKAITIRELHSATGRWVREASVLAAAACQGFKVIYSHDKHLLSAAPHFGLEGCDIIMRTGET
jgi:hypothetical protein